MSSIGELTIAVPRGALFDDTARLLSQLGLDVGELRSNDRRLLFEDIGVITMRPSDVPTYVEAGAAVDVDTHLNRSPKMRHFTASVTGFPLSTTWTVNIFNALSPATLNPA